MAEDNAHAFNHWPGQYPNDNKRTMFHTASNPKYDKVVYNAELDSRITCRFILNSFFKSGFLDFAVCQLDKLRSSTYFRIHENRIEYNIPSICWCCMCDAPDTIYFDAGVIASSGRAKCCDPTCTHCCCCPTCFDICGEGVVIYNTPCKCLDCCCCRMFCWKCFCGMKNSEKFCKKLDKAVMRARNQDLHGKKSKVSVKKGKGDIEMANR
eukprot:gnl/Hemi2/25158_TR8461_c0_g1_i2.p2 gnl/Hemi2/25158_TR8461_c0_g1~~gnl/Hemi2/25158_TR8461_c0_g1_i2.p2  ORF type:complete len:234 (+),score=77.38 gnl/Hemi2/25158_TR8461_c0_g1_i2:74-703(+)